MVKTVVGRGTKPDERKMLIGNRKRKGNKR
jgi:hypothetical protein